MENFKCSEVDVETLGKKYVRRVDALDRDYESCLKIINFNPNTHMKSFVKPELQNFDGGRGMPKDRIQEPNNNNNSSPTGASK